MSSTTAALPNWPNCPSSFNCRSSANSISFRKTSTRPIPEKFGKLHREKRNLYRYRTKEYRIYFERTDAGLLIHRVLHKNTLKDFFFRTKLPLGEDEMLQKAPEFWELIDGRR